MTTSLTESLTLEDFLKLPYLEDSPAWEYLHGVAIQKPMPKTRHSILQKRLLAEVDSHTVDYTALPELRCTFGVGKVGRRPLHGVVRLANQVGEIDGALWVLPAGTGPRVQCCWWTATLFNLTPSVGSLECISKSTVNFQTAFFPPGVRPSKTFMTVPWRKILA